MIWLQSIFTAIGIYILLRLFYALLIGKNECTKTPEDLLSYCFSFLNSVNKYSFRPTGFPEDYPSGTLRIVEVNAFDSNKFTFVIEACEDGFDYSIIDNNIKKIIKTTKGHFKKDFSIINNYNYKIIHNNYELRKNHNNFEFIIKEKVGS